MSGGLHPGARPDRSAGGVVPAGVTRARQAVAARRLRLVETIAGLARRGEVMPDNAGLAARLGVAKGAVMVDLMALVEAGTLRMVGHKPRQCVIVASGLATFKPPPAKTLTAEHRRAAPRPISAGRAFRLPDGADRIEWQVPDSALYGGYAEDVRTLRRRGRIVCLAKTVGLRGGGVVVNGKQVTGEELHRLAQGPVLPEGVR